MKIDSAYKQNLEEWMAEHHDEELRERYAEIAMGYFVQNYFSRDFERYANDCEMDVSECIANLSWMLADAMVIAKN